MSRLLWVANAPWAPSGYGEQTALFVPRLRELGHDVAIACNYGLQGAVQMWQGSPCYPADDWVATVPVYAEHFQADAVIVLHDAWVLTPAAWPEGFTAACWAPVDHHPLPPAVFGALAHERVRPVAMSRFGERMMRDRGLEPLYVPHGVDLQRFRPQPELRAEARAILEIPEDAFLVGMVAANKTKQISRKAFPEAFQAFARFARGHDDAWMFVHTQARHPAGMNLDQLAHMCEVPLGRLRFPPDSAWQLGTPPEMVAVLYQAFDVLLSPSMGEGFGIPILEAQASGVPVIVSDHSAMTELCGTGWLVDGQPWWDELQQSWFLMPFVESIVGALEASYAARGAERLRSGAAAFAAGYDADAVAGTYWEPALEILVGPREAGPLPVLATAGARGG